MPTVTFAEFDGGIDLTRPANMQSANRFRILKNAYVTKGKTLRKRPGAKYVWTWGQGVKGLHAIGGALRGYYGAGNTAVSPVTSNTFVQSAGSFQVHQLARTGTTADNTIFGIQTAFRFAGNQYVVAKTQDSTGYRHFIVTGSAGNNDVTDANCPHGQHAFSLKSKVFATSPTGVVRFSKTNDPANWTLANDAGFLPVNNQASGSNQPVALGEFLKRLVVFYPSQAQLWDVGPDPTTHAFYQRIQVGTQYVDGHANVGTDLFFPSTAGIRSIVLNSQFGNAMDLDVGTPIDRMYQNFLSNGSGVIGRYFPSLGQYWVINGSTALVYSFSRTVKVFAWSEYTFPWQIAGADELDGKVYLRSVAGDIYQMQEGYPVDDSAELAVSNTGTARNPNAWITNGMVSQGQVNIPCQWRTPYLDAKNPAALKSLEMVDVVASRGDSLSLTPYLTREYALSFLYRSETGADSFLAGPIDLTETPDDTRSNSPIALGIMAPSFAMEFTHSAPEDFELSGTAVHFSNLGLV